MSNLSPTGPTNNKPYVFVDESIDPIIKKRKVGRPRANPVEDKHIIRKGVLYDKDEYTSQCGYPIEKKSLPYYGKFDIKPGSPTTDNLSNRSYKHVTTAPNPTHHTPISHPSTTPSQGPRAAAAEQGPTDEEAAELLLDFFQRSTASAQSPQPSANPLQSPQPSANPLQSPQPSYGLPSFTELLQATGQKPTGEI